MDQVLQQDTIMHLTPTTWKVANPTPVPVHVANINAQYQSILLSGITNHYDAFVQLCGGI